AHLFFPRPRQTRGPAAEPCPFRLLRSTLTSAALSAHRSIDMSSPARSPSLRASAPLLSGSSSLACPPTSIRIGLRGLERRAKGRATQTSRENVVRRCLLPPTTTSPSCHLPRVLRWGPAALEGRRARTSTASSRPA